MLFSREPVRGWEWLVRAVLALSTLTMIVAVYSSAEEGTGGFVSHRRCQIAAAIILGSGALVIGLAAFVWRQSR